MNTPRGPRLTPLQIATVLGDPPPKTPGAGNVVSIMDEIGIRNEYQFLDRREQVLKGELAEVRARKESLAKRIFNNQP